MATTAREILDDFLAAAAATSDGVQRTRALRALGRAILYISQRHPWEILKRAEPYQFATVVGQRLYPLPAWFGRVSREDGAIADLTRRRNLTPIDPLELAFLDPTQGTDDELLGQPERYLFAGEVGVHTQPATAGEALEVLSASADDTAVRVEIEGLDEDGEEDRNQVTLTGAAPVALGTWSRIDTFSKAYPDGVTPPTAGTSSAGVVTLRTVVGATELQKLFVDESQRAVKQLRLWRTPNEVHQLAIPATRRLLTPRFDADPIPDGWDLAVMEGLWIEWRVMQGEIASDSDVPRPRLVDLICDDNANRLRSPRLPAYGTGGGGW